MPLRHNLTFSICRYIGMPICRYNEEKKSKTLFLGFFLCKDEFFFACMQNLLYLCALLLAIRLMENYTTSIFIVAILFGLLDLLTDRWSAVQRQLFPILSCVLYFLCIITYYYGPDIQTYVPHYETIESLGEVWHKGGDNKFEIGYSLLCSLLHGLGWSYWWMTWTVKTLYFIALWLLLRTLPKRKIFALSCIVMTDTNLIMHEARQCLAVSFFVFMILLLQHKKYIWAVVCAVVTVFMHKSGFFPIGLTLCGMFLYRTRQYAVIYTILTIILLVLVVLPVQRISTSIMDVLPLPKTYIASLSHHLSLGLQFQTVAVIYLALLLIFGIYLSYDSRRKYTWYAVMALCGMGVIVILYPYYFLLVRLRSYFVPFIVCYLVVLLSDASRTRAVPYGTMMKQALMMLVLVYYIHVAVGQERGAKLLQSPVYRGCTVFELTQASSRQIRNRQMQIAASYWKNDYMQRAKSTL